MESSSDSQIKCFIFSLLQKSIASFNSRFGKEHDCAVTAITLSLSISFATFSKKVESTPLENATATDFNSFK